jgi:acyl transferase domain-containing protein
MESDKEQKYLQTLGKAADKIKELRAQIDALTAPVAVIGMGCRFPGGANDPEAFWKILDREMDVIGEIPPDRWDWQRYYDADVHAPGKMVTRYGGFLDGMKGFDAGFFGIAPPEALALDPQQRLLLEVSWQTLERAGLAPDRLKGSKTGVFIGMGSRDYHQAHLGAGDLNRINEYSATGVAFSAAAGRLCYQYDFRGPCMTVDTACSSSLVALHLAVRSLRNGESDMALAGGVTLNLTPEAFIALSKMHALAADGRCRTFDDRASGYARGEGCGLVALKRLSDARTQGDPILAVIRGSAVNQDGESNGLTAPNALAQQEVIRKALEDARTSPDAVDYIEAHGTGTLLGDPIEVRALDRVFNGRPDPLLIGSVKTNIGHLESAAGIAGIIKVILAMVHGRIPRSLHFEKPNAHIPWKDVAVAVAAKPTPWPERNETRIAGVSAFGFSGTNAHVIVQAPPAGSPDPEPPADPPVHLLTLSAKNEAALGCLAEAYRARLSAPSMVNVGDLCYTAGAGRTHFKHRLACVGVTQEDLIEKLSGFLDGRHPPGLFQTKNPQNRVHSPGSGVVFLFTGQGAQYPGMGRELYETWPLFKNRLDRCDEILSGHGIFLIDLLYGKQTDESLLNRTANAQPALFAVQYALARLWMSWGVRPAAAMGHGIGEYVAACIAGVFSLEAALKLAADRGKLTRSLPGSGMTAAARKEFHKNLSEVEFSPPRVPVVSNSTGKIAAHAAITAPDYWGRLTRETVRRQDAFQTLSGKGDELFLEVGPCPGHAGIERRWAPDNGGVRIPSLIRGEDGCHRLLSALARLYVLGVDVDWGEFHAPFCRKIITAPTYPFQRRRFWMNPILETDKNAPLKASRIASPGKRDAAPPDDPTPESSLERMLFSQLQVMAEQLRVFEQGVRPEDDERK